MYKLILVQPCVGTQFANFAWPNCGSPEAPSVPYVRSFGKYLLQLVLTSGTHILLFYYSTHIIIFSLILLYLGIILRALMVTRYRQSEIIILMKTTNSLQTFYISKNIQIQHKNKRKMVKLYRKKPTMKVCL